MKLSIIIPTVDRLDALKVAVNTSRVSAANVDHEIIVIDGGSKDGTLEWLHETPGLVLIEHGKRLGCVKAFNDGFLAARGEYCAQLSDDVELIDDALSAACTWLDEHPATGQVIIRHADPGRTPTLPMFGTQHGKFPFAAFGVTRKSAGDAVGWWGDYYHQQGDPELTIKLINAGWKIDALPDHHLNHYPGPSEMRKYRPDGDLFHSRWWGWKP